MNLQQIKYFLAVVDHGTFIEAAQQIHVTQPTLSNGIAKLETSLGVRLFHRGRRMASLTVDGQHFLPVARTAYTALNQVKQEMSKQPETISLGMLSTTDIDWVAQVVKKFQSYQVAVEIKVGSMEEIGQWLRQQVIHIAITHNTQADGFKLLRHAPLCVVVSSQHLWAALSSIDLDDLHEQVFIERAHCSFWQPVHDHLQQNEIKPQTVLTSIDDHAVMALVAADFAVSIMTQRQTPYAVRFIPIRDFKATQQTGYCSLSPLTDHQQALIELLATG